MNDLGTSKIKRFSITIGFTSDQGKREYMEDRISIVENLVSEENDEYFKIPYFAIFDGHGGEKAAEISSNQLHKTISNHNLREEDICNILSV